MSVGFKDDDAYDPDPERLKFIDQCFADIGNFSDDDDADLPEVVDEVSDFRALTWGDDVIDAEWEYVEDEQAE